MAGGDGESVGEPGSEDARVSRCAEAIALDLPCSHTPHGQERQSPLDFSHLRKMR